MKRQLSPLVVLLLLGVFVAGILKSCSAPSPKQFDSREWKSGSSSSRGAQVEDLIARKILLGKSRSDVQALLGQPDDQGADWYGYNVITIPRCHFWKCTMDVAFDGDSKQVESVGVSD
jgi:hypothetical protein